MFINKAQDQENRFKFCIKNKKRDLSDVLIIDEAFFYLYHQENIDGLYQATHAWWQKQITPKN